MERGREKQSQREGDRGRLMVREIENVRERARETERQKVIERDIEGMERGGEKEYTCKTCLENWLSVNIVQCNIFISSAGHINRNFCVLCLV